MVNLEGFILSHTYEIVDIPEQNAVDRFLPPAPPRECLDVDNPSMFGATTDFYINFRYKMHQEMEKAKAVCREQDARFSKDLRPGLRSGSLLSLRRCRYHPGDGRNDCQHVSYGCRPMQGKGIEGGGLKDQIVPALPGEEIRQALRNAKKVAVIDRDFSPGCGGIFAQEIKSVLQGTQSGLPVYPFIAGLGGKDVTDKDIERIVEQTHQLPKPGEITWIGLLK